MLAKRVSGILPAMSFDEALETTRVWSVAGLTDRTGLVPRRPFRAPHHTISNVGLVGGGSGMPRPGELSLAHHGVLFLDELPEFSRAALEVMRQPLEDGHVTITRSLVTVRYPAGLMLVASMNPCPCGYLTHTSRQCLCTQQQVASYRSRVSGPLLDRIDLHVDVAAVDYTALRAAGRAEPSASIRARVEAARALQRRRFADEPIHCNAEMTPKLLRTYCGVDAAGHALLERVIDRLGMSARAWDRILKVARTIADLAGAKCITGEHVAEAVQYRQLDRADAC
jgi:magnesium chelatase family protein